MFYNTRMRLANIVTVCILFALNLIAADLHWIRIQSPNFEIYSTAGETSTRETVKEFEQVRAFFTANLPSRDNTPLPVRIIQFNSEKEYQPYRINGFAAAYYKPGADLDLIVMSRGGAENFPAAIHEYVHLVARHAGLNLPPWLNEGLADFYSTLRPAGGKVVIGEAIPGRLLEMQREKWIPLRVLLTVDQSSPYYNEAQKAGMFYAESWALTHMLSLDGDYRPKWAEFARAMIQGKDSAEALPAIYGKSIEAIGQDLQLYAQKRVFAAGIFDAKLEKIQTQYPAAPAPAFDLRLTLLEITAGNSREQTRQQIQALATEEPSRPEPHEQLGYLLWGSGLPAGAEVRDEFAKAYELGGRSPRMLWDYGRMILSSKPDEAVQVLGELSRREPQRRDVKIEMAAAMLNAGHPSDAVNAVLDLKGCLPDEALRCVNIAAYAYLRMNQREQARAAVELYLKVAKTPEDRQKVEPLLALVAPPAPAPQNARQRGGLSDSPSADADPSRPIIARRPVIEDPVTVRSAPTQLPIVSGKFAELSCGKSTELVIDTGVARKRFVIDDPGKIVISGRGKDSIDLSCGPQKPSLSVELGYAPAPSGSKADGALRTLRFTP